MPFSTSDLRIIVEKCPKVVPNLNAVASADGALVPHDRDESSVLGRHFTRQQWRRPCGMDTAKRFMAYLQDAMVAGRWEVYLLAMT